jgi:hypothetical protein
MSTMRHPSVINSFCHNGLTILIFVLAAVSVVIAQDDCAHIVNASATQSSSGTWEISATVSSTETGWDKYASEWKIENPADGSLLGRNLLLHPHVKEQPFTRSLSGVEIPDDVSVVVISAKDSVLGYCGESFPLLLRETEAPQEDELESTMLLSNATMITFVNKTVGGITFEIIFSSEKQPTTTHLKDSPTKDDSSTIEDAGEDVYVSRASPGGTVSLLAFVCIFGWTLVQ